MLRKAVLVACCAAVGLGPVSLQAAQKIPAYITAAVADSGRPAEDKERDANRKPAETVAFAGVKPGSTVVELFPGKGYFTRIFSKVVGPKGKVYAVSPPRVPDSSAATRAIASDPAYSNVVVRVAKPPALNVFVPADVVLTAQN
jgi:predicted methyltransferase